MNFTLRQLQIFQHVAKHLSFTKAAEELFLSQPAVSGQIKQLEKVIGLHLYEQLGRKIYLTQAGKLVYDFCIEIQTKVNNIEKDVNDLKGIEGGLLHVSVATTVNYFAAKLLSNFCQQHIGIRLQLDVTNRATLLKQLERNGTDLVLMGLPPDDLDLIVEPFMDNPLVIIAPPDHPLVDEKNIPLRKLKNDKLLMREVGSGARITMEQFFLEKKNFKLISIIEMNSNEAIKKSVEAGLGLGIVSIHTIELEKEVGRLKILDVKHFPINRKWYIVHRKGKRLLAAAELLKQYILDNRKILSNPSTTG